MNRVMMIMLKKKIINSKSKIIYYFNLNNVALSQKVSHFYCLFLLFNYIAQNLLTIIYSESTKKDSLLLKEY